MQRAALLAVAVFLVLALAVVPAGGQAQQSDNPLLAARLDALAAAFFQREQVPGAIAAVVSGDTTILRGYGFADIDKGLSVSPEETRFEIGSITKLFTWIAVMILVEDGALNLADDIAPLLPVGLVPGETPLSMAHLMSHRPGFEESFAIFDESVSSLPRVEAMFVAAPEQVFPRGEVTSYSNWGVALAGLVVEEVSGVSWEEFIETRILEPLGM